MFHLKSSQGLMALKHLAQQSLVCQAFKLFLPGFVHHPNLHGMRTPITIELNQMKTESTMQQPLSPDHKPRNPSENKLLANERPYVEPESFDS